MIEERTALTIERRRVVHACLDNTGDFMAEIRPTVTGGQYLLLVVGQIKRGEVVTPDEVVDATERLIRRLRGV